MNGTWCPGVRGGDGSELGAGFHKLDGSPGNEHEPQCCWSKNAMAGVEPADMARMVKDAHTAQLGGWRHVRGQLRQVRESESMHISFEMKERRNSGMSHRFPVVGPEKISRAIVEMKTRRTFGTSRHFCCHSERKLRE